MDKFSYVYSSEKAAITFQVSKTRQNSRFANPRIKIQEIETYMYRNCYVQFIDHAVLEQRCSSLHTHRHTYYSIPLAHEHRGII